MTKEYFEKLSDLLKVINIENDGSTSIEVKHFFSGAALYVNKLICVSWSPVGLAFKLPDQEVNDLITLGKAKPLKYFTNGHTKNGYALFENPDEKEPIYWKRYFLKAIQQT